MRTMILAGLALLACAGAQAGPQGLVGSWRGVGMQVSVAGKQDEWTISMSLAADGTGRIEYPSLSCGGTLAPLSGEGERVYRETITFGAHCASGGTIRLVPAPGGKLIWGWTAEGTRFSDIDASAVLFPAGPDA